MNATQKSPATPLFTLPNSNASSCAVLCVSDDADTRRMHRLVLEDDGFTVAEAGDAAAARERLRQEHFRVVVIDHELPDISGLELALRLRQAGMNMSLVFATSTIGPLLMVDLSSIWFSSIHYKPFPVVDLLMAVRRASQVRSADEWNRLSYEISVEQRIA